MAVETRDVMTVEQVADYMQLEPVDVERLIVERGACLPLRYRIACGASLARHSMTG